MTFELTQACAILERTPAVLRSLLEDLPEPWTVATEGGDSWSAFDILGHLVHGEKTDWTERIARILDPDHDGRFEPFDRFAQFEESRGKDLVDLLDEFASLRRANLDRLESHALTHDDLRRKGTHPALGPVTLRQLLATWVVHDLGHIAQIARVMASRYADEVGPWREYLPIVRG